MEYKGYHAASSYDARDAIYHGRIAGIGDTVTFAAADPAGLERAFHDSVDDYLGYCASRSERPATPP